MENIMIRIYTVLLMKNFNNVNIYFNLKINKIKKFNC